MSYKNSVEDLHINVKLIMIDLCNLCMDQGCPHRDHINVHAFSKHSTFWHFVLDSGDIKVVSRVIGNERLVREISGGILKENKGVGSIFHFAN